MYFLFPVNIGNNILNLKLFTTVNHSVSDVTSRVGNGEPLSFTIGAIDKFTHFSLK